MIEIKGVQELVRTSYNSNDVIVLLKDLSNVMSEMSTEEREKAIQSGIHYSEMLPQEKEPSVEYEALYKKALTDNASSIALNIATISEMIMSRIDEDGDKPVLISLARAGIPVGILIKRYIKHKYNLDCPHYAISIIRDRGIDINAMKFVYGTEVIYNKNSVKNFFFIDGWTGKGAIQSQLIEAVSELKKSDNKWAGLSDDLFVLADPANITPYCGTHDDYLLPSACLNSTVSGLTSRTILNSYIDTEAGDFHGAVYFDKFESIDKSNEFVDAVSKEFKNITFINDSIEPLTGNSGMDVVNNICTHFEVQDYKKVKPGIGETTRVLLRRVPWKVLINNKVADDDTDIQHILLLCNDKKIPIEKYELGNYKVCGIIKELSADV